MSDRTVEIEDVQSITETDKALLVEIDGERHWIPKSQIVDESEVYKEKQTGKLVITEWFAEKEGLG